MSSTGGFITKRYRYRIYPTPEQQILLNQTFGCVRKVWNVLLDQHQQAYNAWQTDSSFPKPAASGYDFINQLPSLKTIVPYLQGVSNIALQQKALDLGKAFQSFFDRKLKRGYPKFKAKHGTQSFRLTKNGFTVQGDLFFIAKSKKPIPVIWSRILPVAPSSCTISKTPSGEYYVSFVVKAPPKLTNGAGQLGLDLGLTHFYTDSNGDKQTNPKWFVKSQQQLKRAQQNLSRKIKGSANRDKARLKVAKLHQRISNQRLDFHHQLTRQLVNDNQVIGIETLQVSNMMKNRSLAKGIGDVGWSNFTRLLSEKVTESHHSVLVMMSPWFPSSHLCSHCGEKRTQKLTLRERTWTCHCGVTHDRDHNAAKVIRQHAMSTVMKHRPPGGLILLA